MEKEIARLIVSLDFIKWAVGIYVPASISLIVFLIGYILKFSAEVRKELQSNSDKLFNFTGENMEHIGTRLNEMGENIASLCQWKESQEKLCDDRHNRRRKKK